MVSSLFSRSVTLSIFVSVCCLLFVAAPAVFAEDTNTPTPTDTGTRSPTPTRTPTPTITPTFTATLPPQSGQFAWARRFGGNSNDYPMAIASTHDGMGLLVGGSFQLTARWEGGLAASQLRSALGSDDSFVGRYDAYGNLLWLQSGGGAGVDQVKCVAAGIDDDVYACGTSDQPDTEQDGFLARYHSEGTLAWSQWIRGWADDAAVGVAVDVDARIYVTGQFIYEARFDSLPGAPVVVAPHGSLSPFFACYSSAGEVAWATTARRLVYAEGLAMAAWPDGGAVAGGVFAGTLEFGTGAAPDFSFVSVPDFALYPDVFLARFLADGTVAWATQIGGPGVDALGAIAVDGEGHLWVAGTFHDSATIGNVVLHASGGSGDLDGYLARYNPDGSLAWARLIAYAGTLELDGIAVRPSGNAMVAGS